ncbi:MAG: universal stress protein [Dehalococcoidia bacterium]|nr:universal stress protein [Dehalococcoidia bacterium]
MPSVLVPVTGAAHDEEVVRLGCELLESSQSNLHILYVIEVSREHPLDAAMNSIYMSGERVLNKMEEIASGYKCILNAEIVQVRKAGAAIVREAVFKEVDAIVMGSSYQETYGVYTLDEHIPYVLRHAPCRVILSREPLTTEIPNQRVPSFERSR